MKILKFPSQPVSTLPSQIEVEVDGDKSISHRTAIFSLLTSGVNRITNYLPGEDTLNSLKIAQMLGAKVKTSSGSIGLNVEITPPSSGIEEPSDVLYCGNSGTTIRIYSGLLAGAEGFFVLTGDRYLNRRPMGRVANPLREIGAQIDGRKGGNYPPLAIRGGKLKSFRYSSPIASAQVKSALILAGLQGEGVSYYREPTLSRDHTERMLRGMGAEIEKEGEWLKIIPLGGRKLEPLQLEVPGDPSSGFFFAIFGIVHRVSVLLKNLTLNPTRIEAYKVLEKMGVEVEYRLKGDKYEPVGDIFLNPTAPLKGIEVSQNIPSLIDELPALAIAMAVAEGESVVKNAKELRVKESDRIKSIVTNLRKIGIKAEELEDGFRIWGEPSLLSSPGGKGKRIPSSLVVIDSFGDHRIAMSFAILGSKIGNLEITEVESINTSFPRFFQLLRQWVQFLLEERGEEESPSHSQKEVSNGN